MAKVEAFRLIVIVKGKVNVAVWDEQVFQKLPLLVNRLVVVAKWWGG